MVKTHLQMKQTEQTQVRSLGWEDPLEEGTATYSSILAWKISWTEKPGRVAVHGIAKSETTEHITQKQRCSLQSVIVIQCLCVEGSDAVPKKKKSRYTSTSVLMALHSALRAAVPRFLWEWFVHSQIVRVTKSNIQTITSRQYFKYACLSRLHFNKVRFL